MKRAHRLDRVVERAGGKPLHRAHVVQPVANLLIAELVGRVGLVMPRELPDVGDVRMDGPLRAAPNRQLSFEF
jgi:hypothetical protein